MHWQFQFAVFLNKTKFINSKIANCNKVEKCYSETKRKGNRKDAEQTDE